MQNKTLTLSSILILLAILLTACSGNTNVTQEVGTANNSSTLQTPTISASPSASSTPVPLSTETSAVTEPSTTTVSFINDVLPIFESRCIKCHGGEQTKEGLDLKTYDSLMAGSKNGSVLTAGNSIDSLLAKQILDGKMPKRGPKLTPAETQVIIDWINTGAMNN